MIDRRRLVAILALAATSARAAAPNRAAATKVSADAYDAFWLWAGVTPQPALRRASRLYLLQGEVVARPPIRLVAQRPAIPRVIGPQVWMVIRVQTLDWPPAVYQQIDAALARWRAAGDKMAGLQVDFDAGTRDLGAYAAFLKDLRRRLPPDCKLGVTGLLDWSANGDPQALNALAGTADEAVLQIYQGRHVIPGYAAYLAKLDHLNMPFRIGLLQGGEWQAPPGLERNANFRGYVVFLQNSNGEPAPS